MGIEWVYEAVRKGFAEVHQGPAWIDTDCSVIVNGGPEIQDLAPLTVDDIESVEIYDVASAPPPPPAARGRGARRPPGAPVPRSKPSIDRVPLSNTNIAAWANATKK